MVAPGPAVAGAGLARLLRGEVSEWGLVTATISDVLLRKLKLVVKHQTGSQAGHIVCPPPPSSELSVGHTDCHRAHM